MEVYGFIYKITNKENGKIYIGKTTLTVVERFKGHLKSSSRCLYLRAALLKYGNENFSIETIDTASNKSELSIKEIMYIEKYNSLVPNGYNILKGNSFTKNSEQRKKLDSGAKQNLGWARTRPIIAFDIKTGKSYFFPRIVDAIKRTGLTKSIIEKNISFNRISNGYIFSYANQSGSSISKVFEHAQRLGLETGKTEQNSPTSVRIPRLYVFSTQEKDYICKLYQTKSAQEVADIVGLEKSRCLALLRKWGVVRTREDGYKFRESRRNIR